MTLSISVALCTHNGERFVRDQLQSICDQTRPDEVIVRDDGSTDATVSIVERFAASAPVPVRFIRNETNIGAAQNFGRALADCRGDLIALADQDDVWLPPKLEHLSHAFGADQSIAYAFSDAAVVDEALRPIRRESLLAWRFHPSLIRRKFESGRELDLILKRDFIYGTTLVVRSSVLPHVLPIAAGWSHDTWIVNMLALPGRRGVCVPEPLVLYRQHRAQASGGMRTPPPADEAAKVEAWRSLRNRLISEAGEPRLSPAIRARIDDKLRYLEAVGRMQSATTPARAAIALREIASGRWRRYSPRRLSAFGIRLSALA